jgi:membrane-associated phospholipid phosphatase
MVINLHETWAKGASLIYLLLALGYALAWLNRIDIINYLPGKTLKWIWQFGTRIQKLLIETNLVIILSIAGLIAITIAGALGGSIIYGPNSDPVVQLIYKLMVQ